MLILIKVFANEKEKELRKALVYTVPYQKKYGTHYAIITDDNIDVIRIKFDIEVKSLLIRPLRFEIDYRIVDTNTVEIYPKNRYNFSVEPNGDINESILIFCGKSDKLDASKYENIICFEKGRHFADTIEINKDNTLVFVDEGATVDGQIIFRDCNNVAVDGFGVLTYERYTTRTRMIVCEKCADVEIRNLTIKGSTNWNVCLQNCDRVHIDNVKIIGHHGNSDGVDVCGSRNVLVENCFTRVWDDSLVVKGFDTGDVFNVTFRNCVLWNDFARPMEIGVEIRADKMHDILFEDIDVIHSVTRYPIIGIHHGDRAEVYNVKFENINIEHTPGAQLFDLRITNSAWNKDNKMGKIHDVSFKNINVLSNSNTENLPYHSRIQGYSDMNDISNISFENIRVFGKVARTPEELGLQIFDYVSNVSVSAKEGPFIERIKTKISVEDCRLCDDGYYDVTIKTTFENISNTFKKGSCYLKVSPSWILEYDKTISFEVLPGNVAEDTKNVRLPAGKYAFSFEGSDVDLEGNIAYANLEMILSDSFFDSPSYRFSDNYGNSRDEEIRFAIKNNILMIKSELIKKHDLALYVANPVKAEVGEILFSIEDTNSGTAPAILLGKDGQIVEGPQIGCPEEIGFVFKNYPKVDVKSVKIQKKLTDVAYISLSQLDIDTFGDGFLMELVLDDESEKRYEYSLFGSPIPKKTSMEPRVLAHMFVNVKNRG